MKTPFEFRHRLAITGSWRCKYLTLSLLTRQKLVQSYRGRENVYFSYDGRQAAPHIIAPIILMTNLGRHPYLLHYAIIYHDSSVVSR
jgi:hypothetical protein